MSVVFPKSDASSVRWQLSGSLALAGVGDSFCRRCPAGVRAGRSECQDARVGEGGIPVPLPEVCDQGKAEAGWQEHHWHPYPGNQFGHREQQKKFTAKIRAMGERIGIKLAFAPEVLTTDVEVDRYIAETGPNAPTRC